MKKQGRISFICSKVLPNGVTERFGVVVLESDFQEAKKNYESRGYKVYTN